MAIDMSVSKLGAIHQALARLLVELDALGELTAAAHLTAALDSIEDSVASQAEGEAVPHSASAATKIAESMRAVFGEEAEAVARRQLGIASGASLTAWASIVNRIVA